jgi:hypothetical protein
VADETDAPAEQIQAVQAQAQLEAALSTPVMRIYANGFMVAQTPADMFVVLLSNGGPAAIVNMSYISARTLLDELTKSINQFENVTGEKIPSMVEIAQKLEKHNRESSDAAR